MAPDQCSHAKSISNHGLLTNNLQPLTKNRMLHVKRDLGYAMLLAILCLLMLAMPIEAGPRLRVKVTGTTVGPGFVRKDGKSKSTYLVTGSAL